MKATLKDVTVMSVENNDFVSRDGVQVYLSNVYLYDPGKAQVIELAIRNNSKLAAIVETFLKKSANVDINISAQKKGGYSFFVSIVGISKNGKE